MAKGPPPQPTSIKQARGNPGKRALNEAEPEFEEVLNQPPPAVLGEEGRREWYRVAEQLAKNGLLTVPDIPSLTVYCQAWDRFVECEKFLAERGLTYEYYAKEDAAAQWKPYPQVQISKDCASIIDKFASKFGLTPADRSRIQAPRGNGAKSKKDAQIASLFGRPA